MTDADALAIKAYLFSLPAVARLDVCTGSRTEDNGAQESARCKNCQEAKTV